jgi:hypothetical protein
MNMPRYSTLLFITLTPVLLTGCALIKTPKLSAPVVFKSSNYNPCEVDKVAVLHVVDSRKDTTNNTDLDSRIQRTVEQQLKESDCEVLFLNDASLRKTVSAQTLTFPTPEWVASLGPDSCRWILILELVTAESQKNIRYKQGWIRNSSIQLNCFLFDKKNKNLALKSEAHADCFFLESPFSYFIISNEQRILVEDATRIAVKSIVDTKK